ncbi:DUF6286 domain-containing protein [Streptomyces sp. NPDC057616]|uniref:DUF6286 domain-containing protein n=1 Tax=Streptomyces sp. NPDC057616 TaxID=3346183 RepID=UPI00367868A6
MSKRTPTAASAPAHSRRQEAARTPEPAVATAGGLSALAGLWMIVLALTPVHRRRHTVHVPAPRIDTVIDRSAVASLVRDAVAGVDGVTAVRVRVRMRGRGVVGSRSEPLSPSVTGQRRAPP